MIIKRLGFADKYWSLLFTINGGLTGMVWLTKSWDIPKDFYCVLSHNKVNSLFHRSHSVPISLSSHQLRYFAIFTHIPQYFPIILASFSLVCFEFRESGRVRGKGYREGTMVRHAQTSSNPVLNRPEPYILTLKTTRAFYWPDPFKQKSIIKQTDLNSTQWILA